MTTSEATDVIEVTQNQSILYKCPGCGFYHGLATTRPDAEDGWPIWEWNGSRTHPTLEPSVLYSGTPRCHHYVRNGHIEFLSDCDHKMAGKTVAMPPIVKD